MLFGKDYYSLFVVVKKYVTNNEYYILKQPISIIL